MLGATKKEDTFLPDGDQKSILPGNRLNLGNLLLRQF